MLPSSPHGGVYGLPRKAYANPLNDKKFKLEIAEIFHTVAASFFYSNGKNQSRKTALYYDQTDTGNDETSVTRELEALINKNIYEMDKRKLKPGKGDGNKTTHR